MTQQEMETTITELETTFKQKANKKTWEPSPSGIDFDRYERTWANDRTQQYETHYGVGLWFKNTLVTTITSVDQWDAFKSVARLFCQVVLDDERETHVAECRQCERVSRVSSASGLCEACTIELTTTNQ